MSEQGMHEDHGHSTAAWTAVAILLVGSAVMAVAVVLASVLVFVVGAVICVIGVVAGKVMGMAGYGAKDVPDVTPHSENTSGVS